eukprot:INCI6221.4.p1 GENE.INCI6221.4~~INCI6221.4.p1  ORF type:complete len:577 (-),score=95.81 INCI6221.4:588-2318(-)
MSTHPPVAPSSNFGAQHSEAVTPLCNVTADVDADNDPEVQLIEKDDGSQCPFLNRKGVGPDGEAVPQFAVTVFTISGCPHCIRAKAALKELSLEWEEINLATHPSRRKDMVSLTGAHTVPQIFFDNEHVGDASRVAELLQSGELLKLALHHQHAVDKSMEENGTPLQELDTRLSPIVDFGLPARTGSASRPASRATSARCSKDRAVCNIGGDSGGGGGDCTGGRGSGADGTSPGSAAGSRRQSRSLSTDNAGIDSFIYVAEKHFKYSELLRRLCEVLDIRSRRYRLVVYDHVFVGSEATTVFQSFFELETRAEAVTAGRALLRLGVFRHVTNDHDFKDAELFYRLQLHSEPLVLNSWRTFSTPEETKSSDDSGSGDGDDDGSSITTASTETGESAKRRKRTRTLFRYEGRRAHRMLERCRDEFDAILSLSTDQRTGMVDYLAMARADSFTHFQESVCRLQQCDVMGFDDTSKTAFFLNLYNLMVQHAFVALGVPSSPRQRMLFFDAVKYSVGGFTLSLNDIEHGILRCNAQAGYRFYRQFGLCCNSCSKHDVQYVMVQHVVAGSIIWKCLSRSPFA